MYSSRSVHFRGLLSLQNLLEGPNGPDTDPTKLFFVVNFPAKTDSGNNQRQNRFGFFLPKSTPSAKKIPEMNRSRRVDVSGYFYFFSTPNRYEVIKF